MTDKIADIRKRHEAGKAKFSLQIEVIDSLNYLHSLEQLHDKDCDWQTQLTNVVWWALELIENGERSPSVAPKIWDAFIIGDFDTTLGIATDGARVLLTELIDDRATLLAEVERLRARVEQLDQVREAALNASADWYLSLRVDQRDSIEYVEPNIGLMGSMSKLFEIAWDATPATQNATGARGKP